MSERKIIELKPGREITIKGRGGWVYEITGNQEGADIRVHNSTSDGQKKFFEFSTHGNPYGAGTFVQEPSLRVPFADVGMNIDGFVVGALVLDSAFQIVERFSWSNLQFMQERVFNITNEGELLIDGVSKGYLTVVFMPDKNRLVGHVGVFAPEKPQTVAIIEMEDLFLASLLKT